MSSPPADHVHNWYLESYLTAKYGMFAPNKLIRNSKGGMDWARSIQMPEAVPTQQSKRPFASRPGKYVRDNFLNWVAKTGRPDLWKHHCPTKPPPNGEFEELLHFRIPIKLRPNVGMATCPICSPESAKYFEGALAWFPDEGVLRAIGHECARSHFGGVRYNAAVAKRKHREAVEGAQDFLLDALPRIARLREEVSELQTIARDIDTLRQAFWARSSKTACAKLARLGVHHPLVVEDTREVTAVDVYGKEHTRRESSVARTFTVAGLGFLTRKFSVLGLARNTATALAQVRAVDSEEALHFVAEELQNDEYLFEAEKLARAAVREVEKLREAVAEAVAFLAPGNLVALSEWSLDYRSGAPVIIGFDSRSPDRVRVGIPDRKAQEIKLPAYFSRPLSDRQVPGTDWWSRGGSNP